MSRALLRIAALLLLVAAARAESPWQPLFTKNGVAYDKRAVPGSKFPEYRAVFTVPRPPEAAIDAVWMLWKEGSIDHAGSREYLRRTDEEIVVHDRITTPVVNDREVTLRLVKMKAPLGLRFESRSDLAPPPTPGHVQLPVVRGQWVMDVVPEGTRLTFTCYSEPGGSVPALFVRGALQSQFVRDVERVRNQLR